MQGFRLDPEERLHEEVEEFTMVFRTFYRPGKGDWAASFQVGGTQFFGYGPDRESAFRALASNVTDLPQVLEDREQFFVESGEPPPRRRPWENLLVQVIENAYELGKEEGRGGDRDNDRGERSS